MTPTTLRELALLFFRLGSTAFGGPAAHIAMMHDEVVERRAWLSDERFLDLVGAVQLIPGPNSTELALHIGWERRGLVGLLVAGVSFILPAMVITLACAFVYVRFGALPAVDSALFGIKPAILAIVLQALCALAPKAARSRWLRCLGVASALLALLGVQEIGVLLAAGAAALVWASRSIVKGSSSAGSFAPFLPLALALPASASAGPLLPSLFWVFAKMGSLLFGSGYVLLAFMRTELVERLGWLSEAQLLDAIAVGQITPGPVFTTATFVGYLLQGTPGALVATCGIFLPAFVFVALSGPLVPRLRASPMASAFLDGVNVASLALMAVVMLQLGRVTLVNWPAVLIFVASAHGLLRWRLNATWVLAGSALAGILASLGRLV